MPEWVVANETPASAPANPWTVVKEEPVAPTALSTAGEWKPVAETPITNWQDQEAAQNLSATGTQPAEAPKPEGRGIWQAIKDYPAHFVEGVVEQLKLPGDVASGKKDLNTREGMDEAIGLGVTTALGRLNKLPATARTGGTTSYGVGDRPVTEVPTPSEAASNAPTSIKVSPAGKGVYNITDANGKILASADIGVVNVDGRKLAQIDDIYTPALEKVTNQAEHDAVVAGSRNALGPSQMREAMRQYLELHPEVEGFTGNRVSGARNNGAMSPDNMQSVTVDLPPDAITRRRTMNADAKPEVISEPLRPVAEPLAHPEATPEQMNSAQKAARVIKNIFIPDEVSAAAEGAAADIRSAGGKAARDTETTRATLDQQQARVRALPDNEKLGLIDYIERRSQTDAPPIAPDLVPVADAVRDAMKQRQAKLEALDSTEKARFVEDYYTHMWKDPEAARQVFSGGPAKEGSGRNLKERSIPTIADGIKRGLEPVSIDPLETTMQYVQNMDRFIATNEVIDKGLRDGVVKHFTPGEQPAGWVEVNTRRGAANPLYAPEDWARVYNNFVDKGWQRTPDGRSIYDAIQRTSSSITMLELGLSGFHAATMAQEAMVNSVARALTQAASGKPIKAVRSLIEAPFSPVINTVIGRDLEHVYLGKKRGDPLMNQITELLTEAGGRAKGAKHAVDYQTSAAGSYWDSFKRGSIMAEIKAAGNDIRNAPISAPLKHTMRTVGRILQTVAKPLFEYTIPKMKNGAFYDNMAAWLDANPTADKATQVKAARKIWDSIDNRFGETVQDNIFWNKTLKQSLQVALRSYSWTFGTIQEIGGGVKDLARHPTSLSPKSKHYSPKAAYVIALPIVYATLNAVYQKLKTGQDPESVQDVMRGGLTGGTQPGVGGRGQVKERVMQPGYMKDVFGWYHHPVQEATNKMATGPRMVLESLKNKDWKDQPIRNPQAPTTDQVRQYLEYVYKSLGPISVKQMVKGNKTGSNISAPEQLFGFRPAPSFLQDPEGYDKMMKGIGERDWQKKERFDKKQDRQYNGPQ